MLFQITLNGYLLFTNTTCLQEANANITVIQSFNGLGHYDLYVISRILYYGYTMSEVTLAKRLFSNYYLSKWCKYEAYCNKTEVEGALMLWMAKFAFISWLPNMPEDNFGTILADYPEVYMGEKGKEGYDTLFRAVLGDDWLKLFFPWDEASQWPHPFDVMQHFLVRRDQLYLPLTNYDNKTLQRNVTNLAKLLIYPSYAEALAKLENASVIDIVKRDLENYPYVLKDNLTVRFSVSC